MTEPSKIRILYFDESIASMSAFIDLCSFKGMIEIVGAFRSFSDTASLLAQNDFSMIRNLKPDVIAIRISDSSSGISPILRSIRKKCKIRLVGIFCGQGAEKPNLKSLFDYYVTSPDPNCLITDENIRFRLLYQIKTARLALNTEKFGVQGKWAVLPAPPKADPAKSRQYKMIAIGASAGGTEAVTEILSKLPPNLPPILLVQHLPESFSEFFANNLDTKIAAKVSVARGGEKLEDGNVYLAGYDKHLEIVRGENGEYYSKCTFSDKVCGHRPSVDTLFRSVAKVAGASAIGVILTGMGNDGAQGLLEMREAGACTIGQDKETCAVYGMPMVAFSLGAVTRQLPLQSIAGAIIKAVVHDEREDNAL